MRQKIQYPVRFSKKMYCNLVLGNRRNQLHFVSCQLRSRTDGKYESL